MPSLAAGLVGVAGAVWYARGHQPKDDFGSALDQASELIAEGDKARAEFVLDQVVAPNIERAPGEVIPRYLALRADLMVLSAGNIDEPGREFDEALVAAYGRAKEAGWTLDERQSLACSKALVRLGKATEALAVAGAGASDEQAASLRLRIKRDALAAMIADFMQKAAGARTAQELLASIDEFRAEPAVGLEDLAWAVARAAEIRMETGGNAEAADRLLLDLGRIETIRTGAGGAELSRSTLAELYGLRGEALRRLGRFGKAREELMHAGELAHAGSDVAGAIDVSLGRTLLALGDAEGAHAAFDRAVLAQYRGSLGHAARLGRAESRLDLARQDDARVDLVSLCEAVRTEPAGAMEEETKDGLAMLLVTRAREALVDKRLGEAIELAELALGLAPVRTIDADALLVAATAAREEAARRLAAAGGGREALERLGPEDRAEVNRLYHRAAERFVAYSATTACRESGERTYAECLRSAAECYDNAGWQDLALAQCELLLAALPVGDPDRADVYLRIGAIREAAGAYGEAAVNYQRAIEVRRDGGEYTVRAIVPLARSLDADGRSGEAVAQLQRVLAGDYGLRPDAVEYFNALDLLARLHARSGRATEAAELLHEAVRRCPDPSRLGELQYRLGDATVAVARAARTAASQDDATLAARNRLSRDAEDRLRDARRIFDAAIASFEAAGVGAHAGSGAVTVESIGPKAPSVSPDGLMRDMLREAYMRRADCAFDLGQYEDALSLYEVVDRKYPEHACSMVALIQIVNACDRLGDAERAQTAHRRAQLRLSKLPDDAFFGGSGILSRESWETWLKNHPPAGSRVASAPADPASEAGAP